jgi:type VI secretion system protein ImpA
MDIAPLLHPVLPELPCGPDVGDYESQKELYEEFSQLEAKLDGEMKNGVKQPPRWADIQQEAFSLASKSKHLRLAAILTECALNTEGMKGFRDGLHLIREWVQNFWPDLYPREDRHIYVDSLANLRFLVKPRRLQFAKADGGSFSFEDHETALENLESADPDTANQARLVLGVFRDTPREYHAQNLACIEEAAVHVNQIETLFETQGGAGNFVNLVKLRELFERMMEVIRPFAAPPPQEDSSAATNDTEPAANSTTGTQSNFGSSVSSRVQAAEQLERIAQFFEKSEPSSPLPYLLRRARRCIGKSFMELLDELASTKDHAMQVLLSPESAFEAPPKE